MALQEDRDEQAQQQWLARFSQERQDLSASVEDALTVSQEQQWEEEDDEVGILMRSKQKRSLIPPRLSLQSKQMPTVHPGEFIEPVAGIQSEAASAVGKAAKSSDEVPRANLLSRVAQRITSSLAAFGSATYPETFPSLLASLPGDSQSLSWQSEVSLLPPSIKEDEVEVEDTQVTAPMEQTKATADEASDEMISSLLRSRSALDTPMPGSDTPMPTAVRKPRLAGHTSKIRLQTASIQEMPQADQKQLSESPVLESAWIASEIYAVHEPADIAAVDAPEQETGTTSHHLPAIDILKPAEETVGAQIPASGRMQQSSRAAEPASFFGSGVIESGQGDIIVANVHTTLSSVVYVTLTSNPGPVVVQYISLRPQIGFTIHLTAPAANRTGFNYVLWQGEV